DTKAANPNPTSAVSSALNLNSTSVRPAGAQAAYDAAYATAYQTAYDDAYATCIADAADPLNPTPAEIEAATAAAEAAGVQVATAEAVLAATKHSRAMLDPSDSFTYHISTYVLVY